MDNSKILKDGLKLLGIEFNQVQLDLLELYIGEIELWNKKYKLVGAVGEQLIIRHILDSLSVVPELRKHTFKTVADIGSGAGLPGIPLSIFFPDIHFFLIERSGRRVGFLRNIVSLLKLGDRVDIIEADVEDINDKYDLVIFRAFRNLVDFYEPLKQITSHSGTMIAYKGRIEVIRSEISNLKNYGQVNIIPAFVPFLEEERSFVVFTQLFPDIP